MTKTNTQFACNPDNERQIIHWVLLINKTVIND